MLGAPTVVASAGVDGRRERDVSRPAQTSASRGGVTAQLLLDTPAATTPPPSNASIPDDFVSPTTAPLLLSTATAARWRRREGSLGNKDKNRNRAKSEVVHIKVVEIAHMEEVHGVDVSWLHRPNKDLRHHHKHTQSSPDVKRDLKAPTSASSETPVPRKPVPQAVSELSKLPSPPNVTPPTPVEPSKDTTNAIPSSPSPAAAKGPQPKRPSLLNRSSAERFSSDGSNKPGSKRSSWMNSLSSKFSSQSPPERPGPTPTQPSKQANNLSPPLNGSSDNLEAVEEAEPYIPSKPKESSSSFFSSISRRLSSASQSSGIPKVQGTGGVCPRRVLNVDPNRERCLLPEMDPSRLRKVSFCVDVEIAGGPRYRDDDDDEERKRKKKEFKMKERAEGEALKNPELLKDQKDDEGEPRLESKSKEISRDSVDQDQDEDAPTGNLEEDRDAAQRKKEKKQKSEAERKERKEKRRRRAEENGQIPVEMSLDADENATTGSSPPIASTSQKNGVSNGAVPKTPSTPQPTPAKHDRPTTDPARIYRRCCQLRESPILKRITEQLMKPTCILPHEAGVVNSLDLNGSRLQLADVVTLGDWLAVVPVKHLKLDDADLNDEGIRCILAGLLAAKRPEPSRRKSTTPKHREGIPFDRHQERAGVVEKISLKNNPRITRVGWKHISLFLYMCRSLKAIDVSMNQFPETLPPSTPATPLKGPPATPAGTGQEIDAAEALYQCLSQRLGGAKLEELIMSECGLASPQIRKVVDGAIMSGISRLGLAGNHLDDTGLEHVLHYVRSGVCQATDLGGNDLRGKLGRLADALSGKEDLPCWGLSLADCNLDSASLKPLFAALQKLNNFRFIDLSHNRDLCADNGLVSLLRRYLGQMKMLKRVHLVDVGMSPQQAIAIADALPDGPRLAHLNLLENPQLTALAHAKTEADQEEACAFYASLMAAVRTSNSIICIDIDVPSPDNSEVVKALAKQVVAYSLHNMEQFAIADATGEATSTANATAALTGPHGGEKSLKDYTVPDVLSHLVGHVEGFPETHDDDEAAPDEDYIVGGQGIVKVLQYVLGEKANDNKRNSIAQTPSGNVSGNITPKERPGSSAGVMPEPGKAKKMSKNLLGSARKIRDRLRPALMKEAAEGDDMAYRRLLFLDQTLQSIIERFEEEYPETRLAPPSVDHAASEASSLTDRSHILGSSVNTQGTDQINGSEEEDDGDEDAHIRPTVSRHNSDVGLASRALGKEEGHLHRMGQVMRREVIDSPRSVEFSADQVPWKRSQEADDAQFAQFQHNVENTIGVELKELIKEHGWDDLLKKLGGSYEDLRQLQEQDPEGWENFRTAQEKARMNLELDTEHAAHP